jgi:hypothetical protein
MLSFTAANSALVYTSSAITGDARLLGTLAFYNSPTFGVYSFRLREVKAALDAGDQQKSVDLRASRQAKTPAGSLARDTHPDTLR